MIELDAVPEEPIGALRTALGPSRTISPQDDSWDVVRRPWRRHVDQRPALVVVPSDADDVIAAVRAAAAAGMRVTAQTTGHNPVPLGDLSRTLMVRTDQLRDIEVDVAARRARVGSGVRWGEVLERVAPYGLVGLAGTSRGVGLTGYTLGGGIGWFARSHGLASDSVAAIDIVTADGVLRTVDEQRDPELFWAVRGGGGSFGIVTAVDIRLHEVSDVYAGSAFWPVDDAPRIFELWRNWSRSLPSSVTSILRVLRIPTDAPAPEHLCGRSFVMVEAAIQETDERSRELLTDVMAAGPEFDTFVRMSVTGLSAVHMDPQDPISGVGDGLLVRDLSQEQFAQLASVATSPDAAGVRSIEIRLLGGALTPSGAQSAALDGLDGAYTIFAVGAAESAAERAQIASAVGQLIGVAESQRSTHQYINFIERTASPEELFGSALPRLMRVKEAFDPNDVIHANHPVPVDSAYARYV
ncbi:MAG TPA: FAD-binding oxidoreductase [Microbacterium sp.]|nr:FAD-binding oxidoreductase [Microbacterium sp.]